MKNTILLILSFILPFAAFSQLTVNAGNDFTNVCPETILNLSGSASGGVLPYSYQWSPSTGLSNPNIQNPTANPGINLWYYLTVRDAAGTVVKDSIAVVYHPIAFVSAGNDTAVCTGFPANLGKPSNNGSLIYSWTPSATLSTPNSPTTAANPLITTTYTMNVSSSTCPARNLPVTVTVHPVPPVDAGPTIIIDEGQTAVMQATGPEGAIFWWSPDGTIRYNGSPNADAEPTETTTYGVWMTDQYGCGNWDTVTVIVRETEEIFVYNIFTPNGDGENDTWYIGNIHKHPNSVVQVFNRYGKLVFIKTGYLNEWAGTTFGEELPAATYYYVIDLKNGKPKYTGDVTIIR